MTSANFFSSRIKPSDKNQQWTQILAVLTGCLSFFNAGIAVAWMSPSIPKLMAIDSYIPMTFEQTSYFAIIQPLAMCIFCPVCNIIMKHFGYKKVILYSAIPLLSSWIMVGFSVNVTMLYIARVLVGISDAMSYLALPIYIGEICEKHVRGPLGCVPMFNFFSGQVAMNAIGYYFDVRTTAYIVSFFPVLHFVCFFLMPESPYWLIEKRQLNEAKEQLQILRWRENVETEFVDIQKAVNRQLSEDGTLKDIFTIDSNRRAFSICMYIRAAQQFSGMTAFFIYLQYIFQEAGGNIPGHVSSIICMGLTAMGALTSTALVDRFGRRPLFLLSGSFCVIVLLFQTIYFFLKTQTDVSAFGWFPLLSMVIYILAYSLGFCVIPTMILGELFSASVKRKAVMILNIAFGIFIVGASKVFQLFADYVDIYASFLFFAVVTTVFNIILYFKLIETKNRTLEEIQQVLKNSKKIRRCCC